MSRSISASAGSPLGIETTRRNLIKISGVSAGALTFGMVLPGCGAIVNRDIKADGEWRANAWLSLHADGRVVFTLDRVEMGQGSMTGLTTLLAEELELDPEGIEVVFAGADQVYRNPDYGLQLTGGSNSLSTSWQPLREIGATARVMLVAAAAELFQVPANYLSANEGRVTHTASGKSIAYGDLLSLAAKQEIPDEVQLKGPTDFKYIGKHNKRLDSVHKVRGEADFGIDARLEGMAYAVVVHPDAIAARLDSHNIESIRSTPGVLNVFEISSGIAIVARSYWQARKASEQLAAKWVPSEDTPPSNSDIMSLYYAMADEDSGDTVREDGDVNEAFESAAMVMSQAYELPFLAHATMEPMNCLAHVREDKAEIWAGTQAPDLAQVVVARVTDLSLDDVIIHNQFLGGGFGRRLSQDFIGEAAEISYKAGLPVKLVWSREDDMRNDFYRPASLHLMRAAFDAEGRVTGWDHQVVCPGIMDWYVWDAAPAMFPWAPKFMYPTLGKVGLMTAGTPLTPADRSPYEGADDLPYNFPSLQVRHTKADAGVPVSYWRSVGHSHNGFVTEAFVDELAEIAGQDSFEFKRQLLSNSPRLQGVLELAAQQGGWGKKSDKDVYQGIAAHKSFGSYVAELVELKVDNGDIKVTKVVCAIDCGVVVNPDIVKMQMESCIVFGLTAALYGEIDIDEGKVVQSNFHDYQLLRMNESPEIEVHIASSEEAPSGVGEPGLPPLAPAIAGALYQATGKRFRKMPFKLA